MVFAKGSRVAKEAYTDLKTLYNGLSVCMQGCLVQRFSSFAGLWDFQVLNVAGSKGSWIWGLGFSGFHEVLLGFMGIGV